MKTTNAINGSLIVATSPAITGLFAFIFLKKSLSLKQWLAIAISFFGVIMILVKGDFTKLMKLQFEIGDIHGMIMDLVFSYSQILVSKYLTHVDSILMTSVSSFFAVLLFFVFSLPEPSSNPIPTVASF